MVRVPASVSYLRHAVPEGRRREVEVEQVRGRRREEQRRMGLLIADIVGWMTGDVRRGGIDESTTNRQPYNQTTPMMMAMMNSYPSNNEKLKGGDVRYFNPDYAIQELHSLSLADEIGKNWK